MPIPLPAVIQACARSVREVLLPALDPDDAPAQDQGRILLATLEMLTEQATVLHDYVLREIGEYADLVATIAGELEERRVPIETALAEEISACLEMAGPLVAHQPPPLSDLEELGNHLKSVTDRLLSVALAKRSTDGRVAEAVLAQARQQIYRERLWGAGSGFDPGATTFPGLGEYFRNEPQGAWSE